MERVCEIVPQEEREKFGLYGEVLGVGAYLISIEVEVNGGGKLHTDVLQITKRDAEYRADRDFRQLSGVASRLEEREPEIVKAFKEIIEEAREDAHREVNLEFSPEQFDEAKRLWEGKVVQVREREFRLTLPTLKAYGKDFRRMSKLSGPHFIDLESGHEKKRRAMAGRFRVLADILNGRGNKDPHGGNSLHPTGEIGLLDFGAIILERATSDDLRKLGELLYRTGKIAHLQKSDITQSYLTALRQFEDEFGVNKYLRSIRRTLLSDGDDARELKEDSEAQIEVLISALKIADPAVIEGIIIGAEKDGVAIPAWASFALKKFGVGRAINNIAAHLAPYLDIKEARIKAIANSGISYLTK